MSTKLAVAILQSKKFPWKRKTYSADFKSKLVLKVLEGGQTLNEVASKYEILPVNLKNWKKQFLENMSLAFRGNFASQPLSLVLIKAQL